FLPAPNPDLTVAVIEPNRHPPRVFGDELGGMNPIADDQAAEHDPVHARLQEAAVPDAAAGLHAGGDGSGDGHDQFAVAALPPRRVKVHDVQPAGAAVDEALGDGDGIGAVDRLLPEVALPEADAATGAQVDGRVQ